MCEDDECHQEGDGGLHDHYKDDIEDIGGMFSYLLMMRQRPSLSLIFVLCSKANIASYCLKNF